MTVPIPDTHYDLLVGETHGILTTMMPDGQPQMSVVWVDYDGHHILISTTLERQKGRNMQTNPRVSLLVVDPRHSERWIEVRGRVAEITCDQAEELADCLTERYTQGRKCHFYGDIYPVQQKYRETRVVVKIELVKVSLDAIFK
jgi:PPOX class probable F420-dependent enzyme